MSGPAAHANQPPIQANNAAPVADPRQTEPSQGEEAYAVPPKLDPETLALRAAPQRSIRFRRKVILSISAGALLVVVLLVWFALGSSVFWHPAKPDTTPETNGLAGADTVSGLPAGYGDVPRLGHPLPGDLGRPILEQEQSLITANEAAATQHAEQAAFAGRERRTAELKSARESGVLVQQHQAPSNEPVAMTVSSPTGSTSIEAPKLTLDPEHDPNAQAHKAEFVAALDTRGDTNPHQLTPVTSPYTLSAGSVIAASLITGLRSDVPGLVAAQVTERVYDSATGSILLVPQGARLIGSYDSVVAFGQKRALVVWQRIIMPDGSSLRIDNVPATDPSGYAGLQDKVDFHTWALLKGVVLSTLLGVSSNLAFSVDSDLVQALRLSTQDNVARAGDQITQRNLDIQPTIAIRPGAPVRLVVHKDLILAPWRG